MILPMLGALNNSHKKVIDYFIIILATVFLSPFPAFLEAKGYFLITGLSVLWFFLSLINNLNTKKVFLKAAVSYFVAMVATTVVFWDSEGAGYLFIFYMGFLFIGALSLTIGLVFANIYVSKIAKKKQPGKENN